MNTLIVVFMFLSLNACSMRRNSSNNDSLASQKTSNTSSATQQNTAVSTPTPDISPTVPMTSVPPAPPLTSTQGPNIEMDFASLSFFDIDGFDIPMITITIPSNSTLTSDQFKVQFNACPTDPIDSSIPKELTSCVTGYSRKLQFEIPVFTQNFHLKLELCDDTQCYNTTEKDITSTRYISSDTSPTDLKIAKALLQEEITLQNTLASIHSVYLKLQDLSKYANICPNTLSAQDKSNIQILNSMSETNLDDMFLDPPASNFINFLSQDFITKTAPAIQQNIPADVNKTVKTIQEYFDSAFLILSTGAAAVWVFKEKVDRYEWHKLVKEYRKINDNTRFIRDSETGFLIIDPDPGVNPKKYYMEDPQTKQPLKIREQEEDLDKDGKPKFKDKSPVEYVEINPKLLKLKYVDGHFYRYDYGVNGSKKGYIFEDLTGNPRSRYSRISPTTYYAELGLKRDNAGKVSITGNVTEANFETRKSLGVKTTMQGYLDKSKPTHGLYKARITLSDIPETIRGNVRPLLIFTGVITTQIGTIVNLVTNLKQKTTGLADTTDPICSSGVTMKKDIQSIADGRAAMSMLELQVQTNLGYPFTIVPKSSLKN